MTLRKKSSRYGSIDPEPSSTGFISAWLPTGTNRMARMIFGTLPVKSNESTRSGPANQMPLSHFMQNLQPVPLFCRHPQPLFCFRHDLSKRKFLLCRKRNFSYCGDTRWILLDSRTQQEENSRRSPLRRAVRIGTHHPLRRRLAAQLNRKSLADSSPTRAMI